MAGRVARSFVVHGKALDQPQCRGPELLFDEVSESVLRTNSHTVDASSEVHQLLLDEASTGAVDWAAVDMKVAQVRGEVMAKISRLQTQIEHISEKLADTPDKLKIQAKARSALSSFANQEFAAFTDAVAKLQEDFEMFKGSMREDVEKKMRQAHATLKGDIDAINQKQSALEEDLAPLAAKARARNAQESQVMRSVEESTERPEVPWSSTSTEDTGMLAPKCSVDSSEGRHAQSRMEHEKFSIDRAEGKQAQSNYRLRASVWDASVLIGEANLGAVVPVALLGGLIVTLVLEAMLIAVVANVFVGSGFTNENVAEFDYWRETIAHDVNFRNHITGQSLASGVCNKDTSTPFSNVNILHLEALEMYLGEFGSDTLCVGEVMCALTLSVWFMTLLGEVRTIFQVMIACLALPTNSERGIYSFERSFQLVGISRYKKIMVVVLSVVRMCIVAMLALCSVWLLVFELSVKEILLNAVALEFILRLDRLMFCSLAPTVAHTVVARLRPLALPRFSPLWELTVLPILMVVPLALVIVFTLVPNVKILRDSREALCGGDKSSIDFVVAVDAIGIPWAARTPASHDVESSFARQAIAQAKKNGFTHVSLQPAERANLGSFMQVSTGELLENFQATKPEFWTPKDWKILDVTKPDHVVGWSELIVLGPDSRDFGDSHDTVYNNYLRSLLGMSATENTTCADVPLSRCNTRGRTAHAVVMRQLCPSKCGCDEPTHGTVGGFYSVGLDFGVVGCAAWNSRKQRFQNALATLPCNDTIEKNTFALWAMGLEDTPVQGQKDGLRTLILASFATGGCFAAVKVLLPVNVRICEETSMSAICPLSCGCSKTVPYNEAHAQVRYFCPHACLAAPTFCFTGVRNYTPIPALKGPLSGYACVFPFTYKGQQYRSCTSVDWPVEWCAITLAQHSVVDYWGDCSHNCSNITI